MVARFLGLVPFVKDGRIEDEIGLLVNEPCNVTVGKLRGITLGFAGNGFDSQRVDLVIRRGRKNDTVSESGEKRMPEGIVFVHVKDSGNADGTAGGKVCTQRFVIKVAL